jgi:hypothetical protein
MGQVVGSLPLPSAKIQVSILAWFRVEKGRGKSWVTLEPQLFLFKGPPHNSNH